MPYLEEFFGRPVGQIRTQRIEVLQMAVQVAILDGEHVLIGPGGERVDRNQWRRCRNIDEQIFDWQRARQTRNLIPVLVFFLQGEQAVKTFRLDFNLASQSY